MFALTIPTSFEAGVKYLSILGGGLKNSKSFRVGEKNICKRFKIYINPSAPTRVYCF